MTDTARPEAALAQRAARWRAPTVPAHPEGLPTDLGHLDRAVEPWRAWLRAVEARSRFEMRVEMTVTAPGTPLLYTPSSEALHAAHLLGALGRAVWAWNAVLFALEREGWSVWRFPPTFGQGSDPSTEWAEDYHPGALVWRGTIRPKGREYRAARAILDAASAMVEGMSRDIHRRIGHEGYRYLPAALVWHLGQETVLRSVDGALRPILVRGWLRGGLAVPEAPAGSCRVIYGSWEQLPTTIARERRFRKRSADLIGEASHLGWGMDRRRRTLLLLWARSDDRHEDVLSLYRSVEPLVMPPERRSGQPSEEERHRWKG